MSKPTIPGDEVKKEERSQQSDLLREMQSHEGADRRVHAYVNDLMTDGEAVAFEIDLRGADYLLAELQEERNQLREARKFERVEAWKATLRAACEKMTDLLTKRLEAAARLVFQPALPLNGGGPVQGGTAKEDEVSPVDKQFTVRITPEPNRRSVRVMVEIKDAFLDGEYIKLRWGATGASETAKLQRPTNRATVVKTEFFLSQEETTNAGKNGIQIELIDL